MFSSFLSRSSSFQGLSKPSRSNYTEADDLEIHWLSKLKCEARLKPRSCESEVIIGKRIDEKDFAGFVFHIATGKGATSARTIRQGLGSQFHFMRANWNFNLACAVKLWWSKRDSSKFGTSQCQFQSYESYRIRLLAMVVCWKSANLTPELMLSSCLFLDSEGKSESETQTFTLDMRLGKQEIELEASISELCLQVMNFQRLFERCERL